MEKQTSLATTLMQIRDSLTPDNWHKGSYFLVKNQILCMCAHGAAQAVVNPQCKAKILAYALTDTNFAIMDAGVGECVVDATAQIKAGKSMAEVWINRPYWVKRDTVFNGTNYGNQDVHWLMNMVGLTSKFNDDPNTTLEMVKQKFTEAADLARQLGV